MLKLGSKSAAVRSVQEMLIFLGYAARDPQTGGLRLRLQVRAVLGMWMPYR